MSVGRSILYTHSCQCTHLLPNNKQAERAQLDKAKAEAAKAAKSSKAARDAVDRDLARLAERERELSALEERLERRGAELDGASAKLNAREADVAEADAAVKAAKRWVDWFGWLGGGRDGCFS
jgi:hypothetical protein